MTLDGDWRLRGMDGQRAGRDETRHRKDCQEIKETRALIKVMGDSAIFFQVVVMTAVSLLSPVVPLPLPPSRSLI